MPSALCIVICLYYFCANRNAWRQVLTLPLSFIKISRETDAVRDPGMTKEVEADAARRWMKISSVAIFHHRLSCQFSRRDICTLAPLGFIQVWLCLAIYHNRQCSPIYRHFFQLHQSHCFCHPAVGNLYMAIISITKYYLRNIMQLSKTLNI